MRHITISDYGNFVGITGERLVISDKDGVCWETALSRVRSIRIEKEGVSISSNIILACAQRGIRIYFLDWRHIALASVSGEHKHAVVALRQAQFKAIKSQKAIDISAEIISTKIRNQRAVLLYFGKYLAKTNPNAKILLQNASLALLTASERLKNNSWQFSSPRWRDELIGIEGQCAQIYWSTLSHCKLLPPSFNQREGRGSLEIVNSALNYGYTILQSYVWSCLDNAGFELYAGFLHSMRPGKPSLIFDFMEEYRAWIVDRNVIKLRQLLNKKTSLTKDIKKAIVSEIDKTMTSKILWQKKNIRLENVMQRQAYRLSGAVVDDSKIYHGIHFKW